MIWYKHVLFLQSCCFGWDVRPQTPWDLTQMNPLQPASRAHPSSLTADTIGHTHRILMLQRRYKACFFSLDPSTFQMDWGTHAGQQQLLHAKWWWWAQSSSAGHGYCAWQTYARSLQYIEIHYSIVWSGNGWMCQDWLLNVGLWFTWEYQR